MAKSRQIAGIDGCRAGWFVVTADIDLRRLSWFVAVDIESAAPRLETCVAIGIDVPIGVPDAGPRACDALARKLLSPERTASVFQAPIRPILGMRDHGSASDRRESIDGRRISAQAFNIFNKINEIDHFVRKHGQEASRLFEVHPELAFARLNDDSPMRHAKRKAEGFGERLQLLAPKFGRDTIDAALAAFRRSDVAKDDVLDAFAVLLAARRIANGTGRRVPEHPDYDSTHIDMAIWS